MTLKVKVKVIHTVFVQIVVHAQIVAHPSWWCRSDVLRHGVSVSDNTSIS